MKNISVFKNVLGLGSASAVNIAVLSILSLLIAKFLTVEDFGVTRSITAYMIVLTMFGHFAFHDALASMVARTKEQQEKVRYFVSATWVVLLNSTLLGVISYFVVTYSGLWQGDLKDTLAIIVLFLPFATIAILYNGALQAVGDYRSLSIATILNAVIPFCMILPLVFMVELVGWKWGRAIAFVIISLILFVFVRKYIASITPHLKSTLDLFRFARVQIISGVFSLLLLSGDIILLERLTGSLIEVAYYGLAAFFAKSFMFFPAVIGRVYFKPIAQFSSGQSSENKIVEFLAVVLAVCVSISIVVYFLGPLAITMIYGDTYAAAGKVLEVLSLAIVFMGLWQALSTINVASNKPQNSVIVSVVGSIVAVVMLVLLIPKMGAIGAAWAMVAANGSGVLIGLCLIFINNDKSFDEAESLEFTKP